MLKTEFLANSAPELDKQHAISILPVCCSELETQIQARQLPIVQAEAFNYLAPLPLYKEEKPYLSRLPFLEELRRSNIVGKSYSVKIHNVRGNEDLFSLDTSGFEFRTLPFQLKHWSDDRVRADYIPFLSRWLTEYFECQRVFIYAYNVCKALVLYYLARILIYYSFAAPIYILGIILGKNPSTAPIAMQQKRLASCGWSFIFPTRLRRYWVNGTDLSSMVSHSIDCFDN